MRKICFVLPDHSGKPVGGYKMVFEYANRLTNMGYEIGIVFLNLHPINRFKLPMFAKKMMVNYLTSVEPKWFELDKRIEKISGTSKTFKKKIRKYDSFVVTSYETVAPIYELVGSKNNCYFIQDLETWYESRNIIEKTFNLGFKNIVIAQWLKKIVDSCAEKESVLIPNPIDLKVYKNNVKTEEKEKHTVGFLYNSYEHKGCKYSLEAVKILKKRYPDLKAFVFGNPERPSEYPDWIEYTHNASTEQTVEIYNKCSVFICSTIEEGYGLTGLEAIACGSALCTTDYSGAKEYAIDGYNCLMSPIKDVDKMVDNVSYLFDNSLEMEKLIKNGLESVKKFDWDIALEKFKDVIENAE